MAYTDDNDEQAFDDLIAAVYQCTFLLGVQATTAALAIANARVYNKAFLSMMVNCPASTLGANTGAANTSKVQAALTGFLVVKAGNDGKSTNDFLQEFQIRLTISMVGAAYI